MTEHLREQYRTALARFIDPDDDTMPTLSADGHGFTWVPADSILDSLVAIRDAELAALRQVARGYCPACGRGDAAPTVADWWRQRERATVAEVRLSAVRDLRDDLREITGARWIADALDKILDQSGAEQPAAPPRACLIARDGGFPCLAHDHCATCDTTPAATDTPKTACDCPPTHAGLELCPACPGRTKETPGA